MSQCKNIIVSQDMYQGKDMAQCTIKATILLEEEDWLLETKSAHKEHGAALGISSESSLVPARAPLALQRVRNYPEYPDTQSQKFSAFVEVEFSFESNYKQLKLLLLSCPSCRRRVASKFQPGLYLNQCQGTTTRVRTRGLYS